MWSFLVQWFEAQLLPSQRLRGRVAAALLVIGLGLLPSPGLVAAQGGPAPEFTAQEIPVNDLTFVRNPQLADGTLWAPISPQTPAPRLTLHFTRLQCIKEGGAWYEQIAASDEPYVLIFVANRHDLRSGHVVRTQVFGDVDTGENRSVAVPVWGGILNEPDDLIVLVQIMEHDASNITHLVTELQAGMRSAALPAGLDHAGVVSQLKARMQRLIDNNNVLRELGDLNKDDRIGGVQEVRITAADVGATSSGAVRKQIEVKDSSDGHYRAFFELRWP